MNIREWTLPLYTILMQLAIGSLLALWIVRTIHKRKIDQEVLDRIFRYPLFVIFITVVTAMAGSHFHLSRPFFSIFAVLNFDSSWLSREIAFNILYFFCVISLMLVTWFQPNKDRLKTTLGWIAITFGLTTVYCMGRIYLISTQPAWNTLITIFSFYLTTVLLGVMSLSLMLILDIKFAEVRSPLNLNTRHLVLKDSIVWFAAIAVVAAGAIIAANFFEISYLQSGGREASTSLQLLLGLYKPLWNIRMFATFAGIGILVVSISIIIHWNKPANDLLPPLYVSCLLVMIGEILGRILFYATHVRIGI